MVFAKLRLLLSAALGWFVEKVAQPVLLPLVEADLVPDFLIRFGIRSLLGGQIAALDKGSPAANLQAKLEYVKDLKTRDVAESTGAANEQHYEVPAAFYDLCLGPWKKYSCGLWEGGVASLRESEEAALRVVCQRARITADAGPLRVLDMGCGWGSATLYIASHFPNVQMVSVSNSKSQKAYIDGEAAKRGLKNVTVVTADINVFAPPAEGGLFDRVVSIEMMEHAKNYERLLSRVSSWLKPSGLFFVHIFTSTGLQMPFHYTDGWMARHFFTGGQMPSDDLLHFFQRDMYIQDRWIVNGQHYAKTCNAWLRELDSNRAAALAVTAKVYGEHQRLKWFVNWRLFFLACAELFDYKGGNEWAVSHYLFVKPDRAAGAASDALGASSAAAASHSGLKRRV